MRPFRDDLDLNLHCPSHARGVKFKTDMVFGTDQTFFGVVEQRPPIRLDRDTFILNHRLTFGHDRAACFHVGN